MSVPVRYGPDGAGIGTTVTAWILSLAGIDSGNVFVKLLKPSSFTPVLALIGIILYMFCKQNTKKDTGMQEGKCTAQAGFVWSDILTNLERVSDHCSNIAGCVIDTAEHNLNVHESLRETRRGDTKFKEMFRSYLKKYTVCG